MRKSFRNSIRFRSDIPSAFISNDETYWLLSKAFDTGDGLRPKFDYEFSSVPLLCIFHRPSKEKAVVFDPKWCPIVRPQSDFL